jgi:hypothetical protein
MQLEFMSVGHDGMACIASALITRDNIGLGGKVINDFSLAFVTPLGSDNND